LINFKNIEISYIAYTWIYKLTSIGEIISAPMIMHFKGQTGRINLFVKTKSKTKTKKNYTNQAISNNDY